MKIKMKTLLLPLVCLALNGCVVRAAVDLAATTVMTAGKVVVKGTGAVIDAVIPDRDKKKDREKDKSKKRRPVSDDGVYPGSYPPASEEGGYSVPQDSGYSDRGW